LQLDDLFETLIGGPVTTAGNHRCTLPDGKRVPGGRALREWRVDQAAERAVAGSHWQDTGRVFTTATGTPLGARHIRKMFQDVCERAGLGRDWAPRDLSAHVRLAAVRRRHGDREDRTACWPCQ